jgi:hypothetical protein
VTPLAAPMPIDVGRHALKLRKPGYREQVIELTVVSGQPAAAAFKLDPLVEKSLVMVRVDNAPHASVFVDGVEMGQAPFRGEIVAGRHTFEARCPGFETARQTSDVGGKETINLTLTLSATRHLGKLRIKVEPSEAIIELDGKVVGSGAWYGIVPSGGHQVTAHNPGYEPYSTDVALTDDQERSLSIPMVRESRTWIWWTAGALAVVAGGAVESYFVFKPAETTHVSGTLGPGLLPTSLR